MLGNFVVVVVGVVVCCKFLRKQFKRTFIVAKVFVDIYCLYLIAVTCHRKAAQHTVAVLCMRVCTCVYVVYVIGGVLFTVVLSSVV